MRILLRLIGFATVGSLLVIVSQIGPHLPPAVTAFGTIIILLVILDWIHKV